MSERAKPMMLPPNWVRRVRPADMEALKALAAQDNHSIIAATHVFEKHGSLVGYASVGSVMLVLPWFDTRQCHAEDSIYYGNHIENMVADSGAELMCIPFQPGSPFEPHASRLGYQTAGNMNVTFKKVK